MKAAWVVLLVLAQAAPLAAQSLTGAGLVYNVQHRVLYQGSVSDRTGVLIGGSGSVRLGPLILGLHGAMGSLGASDDPANPKTNVRTTAVSLTMRAASWLELGGEAEARRFDADAGSTIWRLMGGTVRLTPPMGKPGLTGVAEVSLFPMASVTGGEKLSPAMRGTVGVAFAPPGRPVGFRIAYRFERFDFSGNGTTARLEQFRGILAGLTLKVGR